MARSGKLKRILAVVLVVLVLLGILVAYKMRLPKPQIASAEGQLVPDFTLPDQDGNPLHLAGLRGQRVLLVFYRGYW